MKALVGVLAIALIISVSANFYFYQQMPASHQAPANHINNLKPLDSADDIQLSERTNQVGKPFPEPATIPPDTRDNKQTKIRQIDAWLVTKQYDKARDVIQRYLQQHPDDMAFLLLEAKLIDKTAPIGEVLSHYYTLLDSALNDEQRVYVQGRIDTLTAENIDKLTSINAWDILADFLEPLWQFDPENKSIILSLSESYARMNSETLMEYVLASLLPDDPDAIRIRNLLQPTILELSPDTDSSPERSPPTRGIPLQRRGDHFIVATQIKERNVPLMIDTGATTTVLTESAFKRLYSAQRPEFIGQYAVNTAGGRVTAPVFRIPRMAINEFEVSNVAIVVLPMESFRQADGLLGMNFLREFDFRIDQRASQLYLQ